MGVLDPNDRRLLAWDAGHAKEMEEVEEVEEGRTAAGLVAAGPVAMVPKVAWLSTSGEAGCSRLAMSVREPPPRSSSNCATRCR